MKSILLIFSLLIFKFSNASDDVKVIKIASDTGCCKSSTGRCSGDANCSACTTCRYCKHCNSGGSCGICSSQIKSVKKKSINKNTNEINSVVDGQCLGTTKKGKRCSRRAGPSGYCYQHGN